MSYDPDDFPEVLDLMNEGEVKAEDYPNVTHWDYRVVKEKDEYTIREVFYDGETPHSWVDGYSYPAGETGDEIIRDMDHFDEALSRPVVVVDGDQLIGTEPELHEGEDQDAKLSSFSNLVVMFGFLIVTIGAWELLIEPLLTWLF